MPTGPYANLIAEQMIPVRAFENQVFVAYTNLTGRDDLFTYAGLSHGMCTIDADRINADLLTFIQG